MDVRENQFRGQEHDYFMKEALGMVREPMLRKREILLIGTGRARFG